MSELIGKNMVKVDLDKPLLRLNVGEIMASGDALANRYGAQLHKSGVDVDVSACSVFGYLIRPNDETMKIDGVVSGNMVYVDIPQTGYVYDGAFTLTLKVYGDGFEKAIVIFDGRIARTTSENIIDGDRVLYGVSEILAQIDAMEKAEADANAAAEKANDAASHAPYVGVNGHWYAWDTTTNKYKDTGTKATGADGITPSISFTVETGEPGTQVQITPGGTAANPTFHLVIPRGDTGAVDGIDYYAGSPSALGEASPGTANGVARGDHVHPMPTAADVGAMAFAVGDTTPESAPVLWFNTDPWGTNAAVATMMLEDDETGSNVQVEVEGETYGVTNATTNGEATKENYDFTVL